MAQQFFGDFLDINKKQCPRSKYLLKSVYSDYYRTIFNGLNYYKARKYVSITKLLDSTNGLICDSCLTHYHQLHHLYFNR